MKKIFYCDIDGTEMILDKTFSKAKGKAGNYRRRRFKCTICDYTKMINSGGEIDENELQYHPIKKMQP